MLMKSRYSFRLVLLKSRLIDFVSLQDRCNVTCCACVCNVSVYARVLVCDVTWSMHETRVNLFICDFKDRTFSDLIIGIFISL